jgi:ATP-dependent helicase/nuclease subunit A
MTAEPFVHCLIAASAGSGKTHRLTNRFVALLTRDIDPAGIVATTFTRKAAGEILSRVLFRLAQAAGDKRKLRELATEIAAPDLDGERCTGLLRKVLQNLHRLRIGTLDSFYLGLAGAFSLELGLPAGWSICDEMDDAGLRRDALERILDANAKDLLPLYATLSKGETKRSVQAELQNVIGKHYEIFCGSGADAWAAVRAQPATADADLAGTLANLRAFDFSPCRDKRFASACETDLTRFESQDWQKFLDGGLAKKIYDGETTYQKKPIPPDVQASYRTLLEHVCSELLRKLAAQTKATRNLLEHFHDDLWRTKRSNGMLRFGDVTYALVNALQQGGVAGPTLAFRLDGDIEHLLLDEFQDTSLAQWRVLEPLARSITEANSPNERTFFCVGDVKQAIYGWRGGMASILNNLENFVGPLVRLPLSESRRSTQPVIDVINRVFQNLDKVQAGDRCEDGLLSWHRSFPEQTTVKRDLPGYVTVQTGPAQRDGERVGDHRAAHCASVAREIAALHLQVGNRSIGVLCRRNETVGRMIYELRKVQVDASEEGGNPLTDSPAVELMLSLLVLADHPGHSVAWFHVRHSPLAGQVAKVHAEVLSRQLRDDLLSTGYGRFVQSWAEALAPACNRRDLGRLQQLVEMAYGYQPRSTLRTADFIALVREQRVADPSAANVRVMTIHASKGLEFDVVVLPELDVRLLGPSPSFVVGRDPKSLDVTFVCRYADEAVQKILPEEQSLAFAQDRQQSVEESLSLLYVALTRAVSALHLYLPGPRKPSYSDAWYNILLQTLTPGATHAENSLLFDHGDRDWCQRTDGKQLLARVSERKPPTRIQFCTSTAERLRGLDHLAPSRREGHGQVSLDRLLDISERTGMAVGTLTHAWFEALEWLDNGVPTPDALRNTAEKLRADLPPDIWTQLDNLMMRFRKSLDRPEVAAVLRRTAYAGTGEPGFPKTLSPYWTPAMQPLLVERERRFLVSDQDASKFWTGSIDRLVWLGAGEQTVAADVLDFKTDAVPAGDAAALQARVEFYRPQMEAYRQAVARLARLPQERVATRLVFTTFGRVVEL